MADRVLYAAGIDIVKANDLVEYTHAWIVADSAAQAEEHANTLAAQFMQKEHIISAEVTSLRKRQVVWIAPVQE